MQRARAADRSYLISIDTDPAWPTEEGGWWWEVAVPEVSEREGVRNARTEYEHALAARAASGSQQGTVK
jgi:3D-(3,5/4)-trihydroxycyclohexane-1,2-dione acylhydrolase (decyclizing)